MPNYRNREIQIRDERITEIPITETHKYKLQMYKLKKCRNTNYRIKENFQP